MRLMDKKREASSLVVDYRFNRGIADQIYLYPDAGKTRLRNHFGAGPLSAGGVIPQDGYGVYGRRYFGDTSGRRSAPAEEQKGGVLKN